MGKIKDLTGQKFGRLTVIERAEDYISPNGKKTPQWKCKCECGNVKIVVGNILKRGLTQSCGCLQKEIAKNLCLKHGLKHERIYEIWQAMKKRCYYINHVQYKDYGGRGIRVCNEWTDKENGFTNFYNWSINNGYDKNKDRKSCTLDRIDVNGNYEPYNCRWATSKEQANNKQNNHYITYKGKTQSMMKWCEELNLNYSTIRSRLNREHWSVEQAFETPVGR